MVQTQITTLSATVATLATLSVSASAQDLSRAECEANIEKEIAKMPEAVAAGPSRRDWESLKAHNEVLD